MNNETKQEPLLIKAIYALQQSVIENPLPRDDEHVEEAIKILQEAMQLPDIHGIGNDAKTLTPQYIDALIKFEEFSKSLERVQFHKRDYVMLGKDAWDLAIQQRDEIKRKMSDIKLYLETHAIHCNSGCK